MKLGDRAWHERHRDWHAFDRIELAVTPRYKTSGLSGDEWRTSVVAKFWFKGEIVHEASFRDMKAALMLLPHDWTLAQEPIPMRVIEIEASKCDQAGCARDAVSTYYLKSLFSRDGHRLDPADQPEARRYRRFCEVHLRRGDCGREDADDNYEVIEGPGPDGSRNVTDSPSTFGGVVYLDENQCLQEALPEKK